MSILLEKSEHESRVFLKKKLEKNSLLRYRVQFELKNHQSHNALMALGTG